MTRTKDVSAPSSVEACPVCASLDVRALEPGWFAVELDRRAALQDDEVAVEFSCRECGASWR